MFHVKQSCQARSASSGFRSEEHTSELQSQSNLVCRLLLEKKTQWNANTTATDGSGYTLTTTSYGNPTVTKREGTAINAPQNVNTGVDGYTDRNGNEITHDGSGNFTDTLGAPPYPRFLKLHPGRRDSSRPCRGASGLPCEFSL